MKEIVIMAGATDPEKRLLTFLEKLFPECTVRVVCAGRDRVGSHIGVGVSNSEIFSTSKKANK